MKNLKHTKGRWFIHGDEIVSPQGVTICDYRPSVIHDTPNVFEAEANAKLIASAPELLEACKYSLQMLEQT